LERGIDLTFAVRHGAFLTVDPNEIWECLGWPEPRDNCEPFARFSGKELLGFPLYEGAGYFCKLFPVIFREKDKGFRAPLSSKRPIFIPEETRKAKGDSNKPIFITEGPVKALALMQAGVLSIGLIGTWMSEKVAGNGPVWRRQVQLLKVLRQFEWRSRDVFFAFDADQWRKTGVRHSIIRNFLLLDPLGATVRMLLWDEKDGKGIDDYLADKENSTEAVNELIGQAKEFVAAIERADLRLVQRELRKVKLGKPDFTHLTKVFAVQFKVKQSDFGKYPQSERDEEEGSEAEEIRFEVVKPWPGKLELGQVLAETVALHQRFVFMTEAQGVVTTLWEGTTHFVHLLQIHPFLLITGPTLECGKTTLFTLISYFVPRPLVVSDSSGPYIFRAIGRHDPCMMTDEAQKLFKAGSDIIEIYNAGHIRRTAYVGRVETVGEELVPVRFPTFCAKVIALKGKLKDESLQQRCLEQRLARMKDGDVIEDFWEVLESNPHYFDEPQQKFHSVMSATVAGVVAGHKPSMPAELKGRVRTNYRPLWVLAEIAGGDWCDKLWTGIQECEREARREPSFEQFLFKALRRFCLEYQKRPEVQARKPDDRDHVYTEDILSPSNGLNSDKEAPWCKDDKTLTAEKLASDLRGFRIVSRKKQIKERRGSGYSNKALRRVLERYLK
jgi:hypothetical protein